jgi:hypothetical protein
MNNLNKIALESVLAISSISANAEIITHGNLSTDAAYNVIADTEIGREYLRFDTFDLSYAQTIAATNTGGIYEGWAIAYLNIANEFISGITSGTGQLSGWNDGDFGASYDSVVYDMFTFIPTYGATWAGRVTLEANGISSADNWTFMGNADSYNISQGTPVNLLMYRENEAHLGGFNEYAAANNIVGASVPLPATLGFFGMALAGLLARKKINNKI